MGSKSVSSAVGVSVSLGGELLVAAIFLGVGTGWENFPTLYSISRSLRLAFVPSCDNPNVKQKVLKSSMPNLFIKSFASSKFFGTCNNSSSFDISLRLFRWTIHNLILLPNGMVRYPEHTKTPSTVTAFIFSNEGLGFSESFPPEASLVKPKN